MNQEKTIDIILTPRDYEGDDFGFKIDMMRAHLFGNWTWNNWLKEITMTFSPTLEDPAWLYPIDVYFYNVTNNRTLSKQ